MIDGSGEPIDTPAPTSIERVVHLLVPHPTDRAILLQAGSDALPMAHVVLGPDDDDQAYAAQAIRQLLHADAEVLRLIPLASGEPEGRLVEVTAAPTPTPPVGHHWVPTAGIDPTAVAPTAARDPLQRWLAERGAGRLSAGRQRWSRPGWFGRATGWMVDRLVDAGLEPIGSPVVAYLWGLSAILRAETTTGMVYLKTCPSVFPEEPRVTAGLGARTRDLVPRVIAIDPEHGRLLMHDIGGAPLGNDPPTAWGAGSEVLGAIQRAWSGRLADLGGIGCEDRRPEVLARMLPSLLANDDLLGGLDADIRDRLTSSEAAFVDACDRLARLAPSATLIHGDFHPWNVALTSTGPLVFDWSDSSIGHPFMDLPTYVGRTADVAARRGIVDAYLDGWAGLAPRSELEAAVHLGLVVGSLHQLESYRRILAGLEIDDRWDLGEAPQSWAAAALAYLDAGLEAELPVHT